MVSTRTLTYTQPLKGFCPVKRGFGEIGGVCGLAGGIELGVVYLAPTSPSLELWTFLRSGELRGRVWRGKRVLFFVFLNRRGSLEIFQTVPFCFQRKPHLCKCALCPLAYCLNSIVDFCGKLMGALGASEAGGTNRGGFAWMTWTREDDTAVKVQLKQCSNVDVIQCKTLQTLTWKWICSVVWADMTVLRIPSEIKVNHIRIIEPLLLIGTMWKQSFSLPL